MQSAMAGKIWISVFNQKEDIIGVQRESKQRKTQLFSHKETFKIMDVKQKKKKKTGKKFLK